jgi:hypothetical protein
MECSGVVLPFDRAKYGPAHQAHRRARVRESLIEARSWITAGLEGAVTLEAAVSEAYLSLGPALSEVCEAAL